VYPIRQMGPVRWVHVPEPGLGLVHLAVLIEGGAGMDPPGLEGLADLAGAMLLRGTRRRTHRGIISRIADLGASLETRTTHDGILLTGEVMPRYLDPFLEVVTDCLADSRVPEAAFRREKALTLEDLSARQEDDGDLAWHFFHRMAWQGHPLERPSSGWLDTVRRIRSEHCREFLRARVHRGHLVIGLAGDLDEDRAGSVAARIAESLPDGPREVPGLPPPPTSRGMRLLIVDKPRRTQVQLVMGHPITGWSDPDLPVLLVANTMIGGTWNSRLNQEIREVRGWSYGVHSTVTAGREVGTFTVHFFPQVRDLRPALDLALDLLWQVARQGLSEEEVEFGKDLMVNQFPLLLATAQDRLEEALANLHFGRPADYLDRFPEQVRSLDAGEVARIVTRHLQPQDLVITMVAPARQVLPLVRNLPGLTSVRVVSYRQDRLPSD